MLAAAGEPKLPTPRPSSGSRLLLSRSTSRYDRTDELTIYAREKISFTWLVDPITRTLESLVLEGDKWVLFATYRDDL